MNDLQSLLVRGLAVLDIDFKDKRAETLVRYIGEIETWNPAYGLVNASGDELVIKHILDSLAPWRLLQDVLDESDNSPTNKALNRRAVLSDIGTGAGLPGIPLSIIMPDRKVRLIERMGKRISFLESQKAILSLENVEIVESEIEKAPGPHDVAIFRAFRPFTELKLFKSIWKNLAPGGLLFAYKGKQFNAKMEMAALATDPVLAGPFSRAEIKPVWVPFLDEERCVVIVRK
ncbi:MAG TPA: 16S rRNA (guanine(527)-N(7))-methyltransferase RsmG [Rectinemataceae bacterium]|nr:16S rRNA (guanine(527)-N(7))-methyltransferase RsmG [Rectinemataceae bacterium]